MADAEETGCIIGESPTALRKRSIRIYDFLRDPAQSTSTAPTQLSTFSTKSEPSRGDSSTRDHNCIDCRAGVPPAHQSPRRSASRRTPVQRRSRLHRDMVQGFSKQHLCDRNLTKIRIPEIPVHAPQDSRSPNPYLAEVRGKQRASQPLNDTYHQPQPIHDTRNTAPPRGAGDEGRVRDRDRDRDSGTQSVASTREIAPQGGAGFDIVPERTPGIAALPAQCHTGLPRGAPRGLLSRRRGRPPARHGRGRSHPRYLRATTPMARRWAVGTP